MLTRKGLARRKLLESASGAVLFFPLIRVLEAGDARAATVSKRALFTYFPSGVYINRYTPEGGQKSGPLGKMNFITSPLEAHKQDMIMFRGLCFRGGRDHNGAMAQVLAGWGALGNDATRNNMESDPYSLDQRIADRIGKDSAKPSINLSIWTDSNYLPFKEPLSWKQGGKPNTPVCNPKSSYMDIFGNFKAPGGSTSQEEASANVMLGKKKILDFLKADMQRIIKNLGPGDKAAFETHVESLAVIERDINNALKAPSKDDPMGPVIGKICAPSNAINPKFPSNSSGDWYLKTQNIPTIFRLQREIILQAFACNITKVAVWQIGHSHTDGQLPTEGVNPGGESHHSAAHSNTDTYANLNRGHIQEIAHLVSSLKSTQMGDHTLFDETLTFGGTCIGEDAGGHGRDNIPCFLIGNAWGQLKTNRMIAYPYVNWTQNNEGKTYNHLLVSIAHLMGLTDINQIGNTSAKGPLKELLEGF